MKLWGIWAIGIELAGWGGLFSVYTGGVTSIKRRASHSAIYLTFLCSPQENLAEANQNLCSSLPPLPRPNPQISFSDLSFSRILLFNESHPSYSLNQSFLFLLLFVLV